MFQQNKQSALTVMIRANENEGHSKHTCMYIKLEINVCFVCVNFDVRIQIIMQFVKWSLQKKKNYLSIWHFPRKCQIFVDVQTISKY